MTVIATAPALQATAALVAMAVAGLVLVDRDPRRRAYAMPVALVLAVLALLTVVGGQVSDQLDGRAALAAVAAVAALVGLGVLVAVFERWPAAFPALAVLALPARIPLTFSGDTANLLLPLYGVIAAGVVVRLRAPEDIAGPPPNPRVQTVLRVLAGVTLLYALQTLYSDDTESAAKDICFFYVPFALLLRLLLDLRWTPDLLGVAFRITVGVAALCALVGVAEWATQHLLLYNEKVLNANDLKPYFRVNSLFFDPNIYGRYLALTIVLIAAVLLWANERRTVMLCAAALLTLWLGLVPSLSESSFASLVLGLAVLAGLRWSPRPVLQTAGVLAVAGVVAVIIAPGVIGLKDHSFRNIDKVTSGRADLVKGGLEMAGDRPFLGYGSGAFAVEYRRRKEAASPLAPAESHTIPITIAAEQGIVGLVAYAILLFVTLALVLHRAWESRARAAVAAAYAALVLHTLVYASFLEDPLTWALLAIAMVLRRPETEGAPDRAAARAVPA